MKKIANPIKEIEHLKQQLNLNRERSTQIVFIALFTSILAMFMMLISVIDIEGHPEVRNYQKLVKTLYTEVSLYKKKEGLDWLQVENTVAKGVRLTFSPKLFQKTDLFRPGRAKLNPYFLPYINRIISLIVSLDLANYAKKHSHLVTKILKPGETLLVTIRVEGHSDSLALAKTALYQSNEELSTFRAYSLMRLIQLYSKLPAENFSIAGYGSFKPLVADTTQAINRRVEIYLVPQIVPLEKGLSNGL